MYMRLKKIKQFLYNNANGFTFLPFTLGVNITNVCNRSCVFCLYRSPKLKHTPFIKWLYAQPDYMDVKGFERFIKKLGVMRFMIDNIGLTGKGEPLLHPDFIKFCDIMEKHKVKFSVTTNGDFIERYMDELSEYKYLRQLRISLYSQKDWKRLKNIPGAYSYMDIGFYNMTGSPITGTEEGIKLWAEGLDGHNTIPKDFNKIKTCTKPFSYLSLNPDGTIVPCNAYYEIGTWNDNIMRILNSKKARYFRKVALKLKDVPKADCLNCAFNHYEKEL